MSSQQQEWGSRPEDFNQEPRKIFLNILLWNIKAIETEIYYTHRLTRAIGPLLGLIDSLDEKSKEALEEQHTQLNDVWKGKVQLGNGTLEVIYTKVLNYLHQTYLKEVSWATPRYPTTKKLEVPTA